MLRFILHTIAACLLLAACTSEEPQTFTPQKEKTVLMYIIADNSLSQYSMRDVNRIKENLGNNIDNANFLIMIDREGDTPELLRLHKDKDGDIMESIVARFEEQNIADMDFLKSTLEEVKKRFPADKYSLDIWSHGMSWIPDNIPFYAPDSKWIGQDGNNYLNIDLLADAIEQSGMRFDYILFDACLMSSIETLYELRNAADRIIASPIEIWSYSFPYERIADMMCDSENRAVDIAGQYAAYYDGESEYRTGAVTVIDCAGLETLAAEAAKLFEGTAVKAEDIMTADIQRYDRYTYEIMYDMKEYYVQAAEICGKDIAPFLEQLDKTIVYRYSTDRFANIIIDTDNTCGIGTYIPVAGYSLWNDYYATLDWFKAVSRLPFI